MTCKRIAVLDVAALVKSFGPDQGCMHWDLIKVIYCHECRGAGRDDRNILYKPRDDARDAGVVAPMPESDRTERSRGGRKSKADASAL